MMDGPHIFGFSPVALCINLTSALASARWVGSVMAPINAATLNLVGLVLLSVIPSAFRFFRRLTWLCGSRSRPRNADGCDRMMVHSMIVNNPFVIVSRAGVPTRAGVARGGVVVRLGLQALLFDEPVFRLSAGFAIQGLVLDEYVQLRPPIMLLHMQPHLVLIAASGNVTLQPSLSLPRAVYC